MLTLAIVYGGESCEHDVSVITALSAYCVAKQKYKTRLVYYKKGTFWCGEALSDVSFYKKVDFGKLRECRFSGKEIVEKGRFLEKKNHIDCVLVACHGGKGENGALSGYFETVGTPYTCCGVFGASLCMDKVFSKQFFEKYRFQTVRYTVVKKGESEINVQELGYPVIVKPARQGSSVGISVAKDEDELEKKLSDAFLYDEKVLVEKCLTNYREFNCAVVKRGEDYIASEVEEPIFQKEYLDFSDKYTDTGKARRDLPANIDEKLRERIQNTAIRIYKEEDLRGVVRVDFLYAEKRLYVNEVNTIPGGLALYLYLPLGYKATDVVDWMVEEALSEVEKERERVCDYASTVLESYSPTSAKSGVKGKTLGAK